MPKEMLHHCSKPKTVDWTVRKAFATAKVTCDKTLVFLQHILGSGNEREIFYVLLDKSTYLKKLA